MTEQCVIGIGSPHGDDQAGWLVCDMLQQGLDPRVRVGKVASPIDVIDHLDGVAHLWLCDACHSSRRAGSVHRWIWPDEEIRSCRFGGTHDVDLGSALRLAERLDRLPSRVVIWGIEIAGACPGEEVALATRTAVATVAQAIEGEVGLARLQSYA